MSGFRDVGPLPEVVTWQGATVLARDGEGRVLMQLRDSYENIAAAGKWCCFGGEVEPGEDLETAARREFMEETGIDLSEDVLRPLACFGSGAMKGGVVYVFALNRVIAPSEVQLGEGAGFAFLTRLQAEKFDLIDNFRRVLLDLKDF
jgi:8-oxo-dGTP pyrophosphatase MutT (NUDIX family)